MSLDVLFPKVSSMGATGEPSIKQISLSSFIDSICGV